MPNCASSRACGGISRAAAPTPRTPRSSTRASRTSCGTEPAACGTERPGSEKGRRPGGDRLRERFDLGHPGPHLVVEPACQPECVDVVGRMDEYGRGAPLAQPAADRAEPVLPSGDRACRVVPADVADDG